LLTIRYRQVEPAADAEVWSSLSQPISSQGGSLVSLAIEILAVKGMSTTTFSPATRYTVRGFADRDAYLKSLCEKYPEKLVFLYAKELGENEDFGDLILELAGYQEADIGYGDCDLFPR